MRRTCLVLLLALISPAALAQEGPSSADSIEFTTRKVTVTDLLTQYLKGVGDDPVGEVVQLGKGPAKAPNATEYLFPNYRMVVSSQGAILEILENTRMTKNGEASSREKPRFASENEVQAEILRVVKQDGGTLLEQDPSGTNGMYPLYFHKTTTPDFNGGKPYYEAAYAKRHYGYEMHVKPDYFYLAYDAQGGDLLYYRRRLEQDDLASLNGSPVAPEDALATAKQAHPSGTPALADKPEWVFSNATWNAPDPIDTKGHLAYIVTFGKDQVWVDTRTGQVIGGIGG